MIFATKTKRGFTLIEILITIAITSIILGAGLLITTGAYQGAILQDQFNLFLSLLEKVRNEAVNNVDNEPHGIRVEEDRYVLFGGSYYDPVDLENEIVIRADHIPLIGPTEIIFQNLSGETASDTQFLLSLNGAQRKISVDKSGRLNW